MPGWSRTKKRGTIIVDTSALTYLALPSHRPFLPAEQKGKDNVARYADILIFLSHHGYDIIFPEMVAFEASQILHKGQKVGEIFSHYARDRYHLCDPHADAFLQSVAALHNPHMYIAKIPTKATTEAAKHLRVLFATASDKQINNATKARMLKGLQKDLWRKDFGRIAAADLITHRNNEEPATMPLDEAPIYYLSNKITAFDTVKQNVPRGTTVNNLTIKELLNDLHHLTLTDYLGYTEQNTFANIIENLNATYAAVNGECATLIPLARDGHAPEYVHFLTSLQGLKKEIETEEEAARQQTQDDSLTEAPPAVSQVAKFNNRFGDWQARQAATAKSNGNGDGPHKS